MLQTINSIPCTPISVQVLRGSRRFRFLRFSTCKLHHTSIFTKLHIIWGLKMTVRMIPINFWKKTVHWFQGIVVCENYFFFKFKKSKSISCVNVQYILTGLVLNEQDLYFAYTAREAFQNFVPGAAIFPIYQKVTSVASLGIHKPQGEYLKKSLRMYMQN